MSEEIKQKALEGIDGFFTKLTEAADVVTAKLIEVTPEAAEAILNLVQFKGAFTLLKLSIPLVFFATFSIWCWRRFYLFIESGGGRSSNSGDLEAACFFWCAIATVPAIVSALAFLNFYHWVAAFYPEGAIALKALQAVGIEL